MHRFEAHLWGFMIIVDDVELDQLPPDRSLLANNDYVFMEWGLPDRSTCAPFGRYKIINLENMKYICSKYHQYTM
jgi:hypothetical protein